MRSTTVIIIAISWLASQTSSVEVYNFYQTYLEESDNLMSSATLTGSPEDPLPPSFTICAAHSQSGWDESGLFYITDQNGKAWLTLRWMFESGSVDIHVWTSFASKIYLGTIEVPALNFWYTTCLAMDLQEGLVALSVNNKLLANTTYIKNINTTTTPVLKDNLHIGVWYNDNRDDSEKPYFGAITNIQIYRGGVSDLPVTTQDGCAADGDFLAWTDMTWKTSGEAVNRSEVNLESVCNPKDSYAIAFTMGLTQTAALKTCQKLGHSKMTTITSQEELATYITWFQETAPVDTCHYVWTPFSDAATEGIFLNMNDNSPGEFLPWANKDPNGGSEQSAVMMELSLGLKPYKDTYEHYTNCFSCSLKSTFSVKSLGACQHSYLGEERIFFISRR